MGVDFSMWRVKLWSDRCVVWWKFGRYLVLARLLYPALVHITFDTLTLL